ncbi:PAC10 (YGR078C) [Zygosaccharomyces parabailii]|uniref:Prefoldin subunit 3 n=1 Tax=Zygosaccharomyces bailii (strain CLIB 213 / ATCC 58445 / CBS 680 / BCRC 21525 / NBRC 1098 / NCYC 1416 / NRRL Y-2227) TaxID=1333698 RepID=A0A8J2T1Y3_ZYGB2|nr:PAC10 (YGR078C) [Zygosaccharomyces parabailii]CDF87606.1 BN860_10264g1_1 [Zygosaccharomyces bailii CLIB 213]CDH15340.1 probable Prefoldin subunit 3 [Zygosaccharomyces bailii ISA1307]SJM87814.1 probable Prefoldin subunit 3 [Zygosaccharomyces bailii]
MDSLMNTGKTNPRGIPEAPFVEKVEDFIKDPSDFDLCFSKFQERLSMYKYMLESKMSNIRLLKTRIPDIENTLKVCRQLQNREEPLETNYQLNDTLFTTAIVETGPELKVGLWLGADVMLEYPVHEAIELLVAKLSDAKENLRISTEDVEFLRENVTTMEVNCARLYNWDVERRQALKKAEQGTKDLKI